MSRSLSLMTDELYAPARPRSDVMMTTAARLTSDFSVVSGWSSLEKVATADTARVRARAYGLDSRTASCALTTRAAAMSSIARVIFLVELTARMRFRSSRICAPIRFRLPEFCCARRCRSALLLDDLLLLGRQRLGGRVVLRLVARLDAVG